MSAFTHSSRILFVSVVLLASCVIAAPVAEGDLSQSQALDYHNEGETSSCYYNFQHYEEGDRIITNEPCLNCTCHKRMLMCYLRVCPFTKAIGQDCTIEKRPDQCCPIITCPEVPVKLLTSSTTPHPATPANAVGHVGNYGCMLSDNTFYPDGAQVPSDPKKPCELCYCIRNRTACVMQECTLNVEGCHPVYQDAVCCPVRYDCDFDEIGTTARPSTGGLLLTTPNPLQCRYGDTQYNDGELIVTEKPCEHCYCMRGDIVCAVRSCGTPLEGKDCEPIPPSEGECCPTTYQCANGTIPLDPLSPATEISSPINVEDIATKGPIPDTGKEEDESTKPSGMLETEEKPAVEKAEDEQKPMLVRGEEGIIPDDGEIMSGETSTTQDKKDSEESLPESKPDEAQKHEDQMSTSEDVGQEVASDPVEEDGFDDELDILPTSVPSIDDKVAESESTSALPEETSGHEEVADNVSGEVKGEDRVATESPEAESDTLSTSAPAVEEENEAIQTEGPPTASQTTEQESHGEPSSNEGTTQPDIKNEDDTVVPSSVIKEQDEIVNLAESETKPQEYVPDSSTENGSSSIDTSPAEGGAPVESNEVNNILTEDTATEKAEEHVPSGEAESTSVSAKPFAEADDSESEIPKPTPGTSESSETTTEKNVSINGDSTAVPLHKIDEIKPEESPASGEGQNSLETSKPSDEIETIDSPSTDKIHEAVYSDAHDMEIKPGSSNTIVKTEEGKVETSTEFASEESNVKPEDTAPVNVGDGEGSPSAVGGEFDHSHDVSPVISDKTDSQTHHTDISQDGQQPIFESTVPEVTPDEPETKPTEEGAASGNISQSSGESEASKTPTPTSSDEIVNVIMEESVPKPQEIPEALDQVKTPEEEVAVISDKKENVSQTQQPEALDAHMEEVTQSIELSADPESSTKETGEVQNKPGETEQEKVPVVSDGIESQDESESLEITQEEETEIPEGPSKNNEPMVTEVPDKTPILNVSPDDMIEVQKPMSEVLGSSETKPEEMEPVVSDQTEMPSEENITVPAIEIKPKDPETPSNNIENVKMPGEETVSEPGEDDGTKVEEFTITSVTKDVTEAVTGSTPEKSTPSGDTSDKPSEIPGPTVESSDASAGGYISSSSPKTENDQIVSSTESGAQPLEPIITSDSTEEPQENEAIDTDKLDTTTSTEGLNLIPKAPSSVSIDNTEHKPEEGPISPEHTESESTTEIPQVSTAEGEGNLLDKVPEIQGITESTASGTNPEENVPVVSDANESDNAADVNPVVPDQTVVMPEGEKDSSEVESHETNEEGGVQQSEENAAKPDDSLPDATNPEETLKPEESVSSSNDVLSNEDVTDTTSGSTADTTEENISPNTQEPSSNPELGPSTDTSQLSGEKEESSNELSPLSPVEDQNLVKHPEELGGDKNPLDVSVTPVDTSDESVHTPDTGTSEVEKPATESDQSKVPDEVFPPKSDKPTEEAHQTTSTDESSEKEPNSTETPIKTDTDEASDVDVEKQNDKKPEAGSDIIPLTSSSGEEAMPVESTTQDEVSPALNEPHESIHDPVEENEELDNQHPDGVKPATPGSESPIANEITDDHQVSLGQGGSIEPLAPASHIPGPSGVIPGEGDCLVDGKTYTNNSAIPSKSPCHKECTCLSSIVHCQGIDCPPPPPHLVNCMPVHQGDMCCPMYACDGKTPEGLQSQSQIGTTDEVNSETAATPSAGSVTTDTPETKPADETSMVPNSDETAEVSSVSDSKPEDSHISDDKDSNESLGSHIDGTPEEENKPDDSKDNAVEEPTEPEKTKPDPGLEEGMKPVESEPTTVEESSKPEDSKLDTIAAGDGSEPNAIEQSKPEDKRPDVPEESSKPVDSEPDSVPEEGAKTDESESTPVDSSKPEDSKLDTVAAEDNSEPNAIEESKPDNNEPDSVEESVNPDSDKPLINEEEPIKSDDTLSETTDKISVSGDGTTSSEHSDPHEKPVSEDDPAATDDSSSYPTSSEKGSEEQGAPTMEPTAGEKESVTDQPNTEELAISPTGEMAATSEAVPVTNENEGEAPLEETTSHDLPESVNHDKTATTTTASEGDEVSELSHQAKPDETEVQLPEDHTQMPAEEETLPAVTEDVASGVESSAPQDIDHQEVPYPAEFDGENTDDDELDISTTKSTASEDTSIQPEETNPPLGEDSSPVINESNDVNPVASTAVPEPSDIKEPEESTAVISPESDEKAHVPEITSETDDSHEIGTESTMNAGEESESKPESSSESSDNDTSSEEGNETSTAEQEQTSDVEHGSTGVEAPEMSSEGDGPSPAPAEEISPSKPEQEAHDVQKMESENIPQPTDAPETIYEEPQSTTSPVSASSEDIVTPEGTIIVNQEDAGKPIVESDSLDSKPHDLEPQLSVQEPVEHGVVVTDEPVDEISLVTTGKTTEAGEHAEVDGQEIENADDNTPSGIDQSVESSPEVSGPVEKQPVTTSEEQGLVSVGGGDSNNDLEKHESDDNVPETTQQSEVAPGETHDSQHKEPISDVQKPPLSESEPSTASNEPHTVVEHDLVQSTGEANVPEEPEQHVDDNVPPTKIHSEEGVPVEETLNAIIPDELKPESQPTEIEHEAEAEKPAQSNETVDEEVSQADVDNNKGTQMNEEKIHEHETTPGQEETKPIDVEDAVPEIPDGLEIEHSPASPSGLEDIPHETEISQSPDIIPILGEDHTSDVGVVKPESNLPSGTPEEPSDHEDEFPSGGDMDYDVSEDGAFGPGTCRYGGKVYVSAQQIPRDDPCDFCFCFRSDIICLQQSCPPPIHRCHQEPIQGYCCPRYQCPVSMATRLNVTTSTTTTTTTLPPHFFPHAYHGAARQTGCQVRGRAYSVGEAIASASGPCLQCICGADGQMKCDPVVCSPEPMLRKMMEAAVSRRRR